MRNEIALESIIEDYLKGKLSPEETHAFEQLRASDPSVDHRVVTHMVFLESMKQYAEVLQLKEQMDAAHQQLDVETLSTRLRPHRSKIVRLWQSNRSAIAIVASFLFFSLIVFYSHRSQTKQEGTLKLLSGEVSKIKHSQSTLIRKVDNTAKNFSENSPAARFSGSGFAIASNGYILTNYHVIKGADSVYIQNSKGESFRVKAFYTDPINDIAILKINDLSFSNLGSLPYSIRKTGTGIGEQVYTLGYPKDDVVLGDGYVSSKTGMNGDSLAYQVAIPVNPGNSGGPLLDNHGNIVGVINGKENKTDGAAFAIKSKYIIEALNAIPQDSLQRKVPYGKRSQLQGLKRNKQVEKIQSYVFMIKVYK